MFLDDSKGRHSVLLPQAETCVSSQTVFKGAIITVRLDEVSLPNGLVRPREVVTHPGGVVVGAQLDNGDFLLVQQFRYAIGQTVLEFPAGKREPGESTLASIQRELEEETGYIASNWQEITQLIMTPGFCNEWITLFKANGLQQSPNPRREEDECITVLQKSATELWEMVNNGTLVDAKTICALSLIAPRQGAGVHAS